jgi:hypothetical protein
VILLEDLRDVAGRVARDASLREEQRTVLEDLHVDTGTGLVIVTELTQAPDRRFATPTA